VRQELDDPTGWVLLHTGEHVGQIRDRVDAMLTRGLRRACWMMVSQPSGAVAEENSTCGCSVPGRGSASGMALVMLGVGALAFRRRRAPYLPSGDVRPLRDGYHQTHARSARQKWTAHAR
jgi:MYXO-CTERM domain-containing protein